jgi:hypothetical protein
VTLLLADFVTLNSIVMDRLMARPVCRSGRRP